MQFILASQSPRRREILTMLGLGFEVITSDADEACALSDPAALVETLSVRKGAAVAERLRSLGRDLSDTVIISSDTVVSIDGEILGKPRDEADACRMLRLYSGRTHEVFSGISLMGRGREAVSHAVTEVTFSPMTEKEILSYVRAVRPYDKAGAYAIQGEASVFIEGIKGDYFNVVGLPVFRMAELYRTLYGENMIFPAKNR